MIREKTAPARCTGCKQPGRAWRHSFCTTCWHELPEDLQDRLEWATVGEHLEGDELTEPDPVEVQAATSAAVDFLVGRSRAR